MLRIENHLSKLPILLEVVKAGSIRGAAKELRVAQPSVSRAMSALESALDIRLFTRSQAGIALTAQGQEVFAFADRLRRESRILEGRLCPEEWNTRELVIGAYESIAVYLFPRLIAHLSAVQPELKLRIRTAPSQKLVEDLRRGSFDFILSVNPSSYPDVRSEILFYDSFRLYRPTHGTFENTPLISMFSARDKRGQTIEEFVSATPLATRRQFACESFESARSLVAAGLGLGILPGQVGRPHVSRGDLVEIGLTKRAKFWHFGDHMIAMSYLAHRDGDPTVQWMRQQIEQFMKTSTH